MNGVEANEIMIAAPPPGGYFLQVIARDRSAPADHWQLPFDVYADPKTDQEYPGTLAFEVK